MKRNFFQRGDIFLTDPAKYFDFENYPSKFFCVASSFSNGLVMRLYNESFLATPAT